MTSRTRMGAWIETKLGGQNDKENRRTRMGAWIETWAWATPSSLRPVAPVWVRGLKHVTEGKILVEHRRTRMGAWIETFVQT